MKTTLNKPIQMVDLKNQYLKIQAEIDQSFREVLTSCQFIKGPKVLSFEQNLATYLGVQEVISCANGTDALQLAMMALDLQPGDEVIVPAFTYVATAEVIALLKLKPVMVDVDMDDFNTNAAYISNAITSKTKAIVPVHLFGQSAPMEAILALAKAKGLYVIEDNAQAIGSDYTLNNGRQQKVGTIGDIGCTSFFPSKNLGCYGDGGALFTNDKKLATKIRSIANHGQSKRYHHQYIGVNSRLDALQAAVLDIKLKYLDQYNTARQKVANQYDAAFQNIPQLKTPTRSEYSTHIFHQYTLQAIDFDRDDLIHYLKEKGIPAMIYYPIPLYQQVAFAPYASKKIALPNTEKLCQSVFSLPIHTEMDANTQAYIIEGVSSYFK